MNPDRGRLLWLGSLGLATLAVACSQPDKVIATPTVTPVRFVPTATLEPTPTPSLWPEDTYQWSDQCVIFPLTQGFRIIQYFGGHPGLDLSFDRAGDQVISPFSGEVVFSGWNGWGYGNLVVVESSFLNETGETRYATSFLAHLDDFSVEAGQQVIQGNLLGHVGSTGNSRDPHLHVEVRVSQISFSTHGPNWRLFNDSFALTMEQSEFPVWHKLVEGSLIPVDPLRVFRYSDCSR